MKPKQTKGGCIDLVEKMKLIHVQGTLPHLDEFLGRCCLDGRVNLEPASQYMSASLGYGPLNEEDPYTPLVARIETLAQQLEAQLPATPARPLGASGDDAALLDQLGHKLTDLRGQRDSLVDQQRLCEEGIAQYSHFLSLKANVDEITSCTHVKVRFGFLPKAGYNKLMSSYADDPYILFVPCSQTPEGYWGVYLTPRSRSQETDGIFSMLYFEPLRVPGAAGSPAEIVEHFRENLELVQKSIDELDAEIRNIWTENEEKIEQIYAAARYGAAVFSLRHFAAVKGQHFFCVGWVPASQIDAITQEARAIEGIRLTVDEPDPHGRQTPPTKLRNPWFVRPFEFFVEMYGLPNYDETDATPFVALTFTVLFGIMFGDVGQGVVLTLFSLFMWKVKKNALFHLMIPCGIASTIAGFVYGSFFGYEEFLDPLYHAVGLPGKPVSVMESINGILIFAVYIGVVLVLAAMGMNIYTQARRGKWGSVLFGTNSVTGVLTYLAGVDLVSAFMGATVFAPVPLAAVVLGLGLASLLFAEVLAPLFNGEPDWKPADGWGGYLMQNVFELLESVLSYLSNTISFLRVGAFVIVHASMMMVVFTLAGEPSNLVVVVLGNGVVIALEALLSAIQGIRLEFYEMFSRFYVGGGRKFEALNLAEASVQPGKSV